MVVLANLRAGCNGDQTALGRLVDSASFSGYHQVEFEERIQNAARKLGLTQVSMRELAAEINLTKASTAQGFDDRPNSVYLPLIGRSKAVSLLSDLTLNRDSLGVHPGRGGAGDLGDGRRQVCSTLISRGTLAPVDEMILR
jgi:hypothetical protein